MEPHDPGEPESWEDPVIALTILFGLATVAIVIARYFL